MPVDSGFVRFGEEAGASPKPAADHLPVLARAGELLASSLDYEKTLQTVIQVAAPLLGDFGFFDVVEPGSGVRRIALAPGDARRQAILDQTRWVRSERTDMNLCALSTGAPGLHAHVDDAWLSAVAVNAGHRAVMDELAFGSMMTVPLPGRDGAAGALTMFFNRGGRTHTRDDVLLGMEIASRAAVAVQNARLLRDLRDAVRLRDEFLAMASHELRTPLAAVRLNVETLLLRARREPLSRETLVTKLEGTGRQVTRLAELVDRILDVSRIEAGVLTLERRDCDLADELRGAVAELEPERAQAGSRISVEAPATLLAHLDVTRVRQALRNLVHNALKYGEGRPVSVTLAARDGNAEVRVADQGIGIAAEDQARIFERFTRAAGARHYQGLGVGLFIAREVARAHGGALSVDSVAGEGSTFTLELPLPR